MGEGVVLARLEGRKEGMSGGGDGKGPPSEEEGKCYGWCERQEGPRERNGIEQRITLGVNTDHYSSPAHHMNAESLCYKKCACQDHCLAMPPWV